MKKRKCALLFGLVSTVYVRTGAIMAPDTGTHPYIFILQNIHLTFICTPQTHNSAGSGPSHNR